MSRDLFAQETVERFGAFDGTQVPDPDVFTGFAEGSGKLALRGIAGTGRAMDLLGALPAITRDYFKGGTEEQDKYFALHDFRWNRLIDDLTPGPKDVGVAGQIVGSLMGTLPQILINPPLGIASLSLSASEDLVREGVPAWRANLVGTAQAAATAVGMRVPLGENLLQRMLIGGAAANVGIGMASRAISGAILKGLPEAEQFKVFDTTQISVDLLMGLAFGAYAHLTPGQKAKGGTPLRELSDFAQRMKPSEIDALATLRQAQHAQSDSMPGKPIDPTDVEAHVNRLKAALGQLIRDEAVHVQDMPEPKFTTDPAKDAGNVRRMSELVDSAEEIRKAEGLTDPRLELEQVPPRVFRQPFDMSVDELRAAIEDKKLSDDDKLIMAFGEEQAKEFKRLDRAMNSSNNEKADKAYAEFNAKFGKLTPEQDRLAYGVGETDAQVEDLQAVLAAREWAVDLIHAPIQEVARVLTRGMLDARANDIAEFMRTGTGSAYTQAAAARIQVALQELARRGSSKEEINAAVSAAMVARGFGQSDAKDVLDSFKNNSRQEPTLGQPRIAPPEPASGAGFPPPLGTEGETPAGAVHKTEVSAEEIQLVARASALDAAAVEKAGRDFANDPTAFINEMRSIVRGEEGQAQETSQAKSETTEGGNETDRLLAQEADRFVAEKPDQMIDVGTDAAGNPIQMTAKQYLEEARAVAAQAREDIKLLEVAAGCLLGRS